MGMTYRQIGRILHMSHEKVRQIEQRALRKLAAHPDIRKILEEYDELDHREGNWDGIQTLFSKLKR